MAKTETAATPSSKEYPYTITTTRDQMSVGSDGRLVPTKVIYWTTPMGDTGHVEITKDRFSEANVRALIEAEIDELLKLRGF